jgi:hypothetical protein
MKTLPEELQERGLVFQHTGSSLEEILGKSRTFYLGIDPTADKRYFTGMPSPGAAGVVLASVFAFGDQMQGRERLWVLLIVAVPALLMVSTIRFRSFRSLVSPKSGRPYGLIIAPRLSSPRVGSLVEEVRHRAGEDPSPGPVPCSPSIPAGRLGPCGLRGPPRAMEGLLAPPPQPLVDVAVGAFGRDLVAALPEVACVVCPTDTTVLRHVIVLLIRQTVT